MYKRPQGKEKDWVKLDDVCTHRLILSTVEIPLVGAFGKRDSWEDISDR